MGDSGPDGSDLCGNGLIDDDESCDGREFGGRSCATETGLSHGELRCREDCSLDISGCHECGNGAVEGPEECEGEDFWGHTCDSRKGMAEGSLLCDADCRIDDSGCYECGDGLVTGPEECDDGALLDGDGCSANCTLESGFGCSGEPSTCGCTVYVNAAGPAQGQAEDGTSWANAFSNLEEGVLAARDLVYDHRCPNKVMIWIARGTYRLADMLRMRTGLELYGGFSGDETVLERRSQDPRLTVITPGPSYVGPLLEVDVDHNVVLDTLTFDGGRADFAQADSPGALWVHRDSDATVTNCRFTNNRGRDGGAILVAASVLWVYDTVFENNLAQGDGGAVFVMDEGALRAFASSFRANQASGRGGAIAVMDGRRFVARGGCSFENNVAENRGGALYLRNLDFEPILTDLTFMGNESGRAGAVLYVDSSGLGPFSVVRSVLADNHWNWSSAESGGGLISLLRNDNGVILQDVLITDNGPLTQYSGPLASGYGGPVQLINVTFSGNQAEAPGDWNTIIANSILWGNEWTDVRDWADCRYSVLEDTGLCQSSEGVLETDPLFVASNNGDYHLQAGSPCIDAADGDLADASDLEQNPRVDLPNVADTGVGQPSYVDMGAYEYQP